MGSSCAAGFEGVLAELGRLLEKKWRLCGVVWGTILRPTLARLVASSSRPATPNEMALHKHSLSETGMCADRVRKKNFTGWNKSS
jgi:hypothetical protein